MAIIPLSLTKPIEEDPSLIENVAIWHFAREIPIEQIKYVEGLLPREDAIRVVDNENEFGALHFDMLTPYGCLELGNKECEDKAILEMDLFEGFDVLLHSGKRKEIELIEKLRKRYEL